MSQEKRSVSRTLVKRVAAGLVAGAAAGLMDRVTDRLVSEDQKRREKQVREDAAHKMAGPYFARKLLGHELSESGRRRARSIFAVTYGVMWGLIYGGVREKLPSAGKFMGLPFGVPFFFACDGTMAPLLGVSPGIDKIPWQINAKEMGNHIAWTFTAEAVHRLMGNFSAKRRNAIPPAAVKRVPEIGHETKLESAA